MTGHNPTDRGKLGTKRHILTDKKGIPLSTIDNICKYSMMSLLQSIQLIAGLSKDNHHPNKNKKKQNLCLDKAYHSKDIEQEIVKRGYILHIYDIEEKKEYFIKNIQKEDGL